MFSPPFRDEQTRLAPGQVEHVADLTLPKIDPVDHVRQFTNQTDYDYVA